MTLRRWSVVLITGLLTMLCLSGCICRHVWEEATCTTAKVCVECGKTDGEANGHSFSEATCSSPKICSVCKAAEGAMLGHSGLAWETTKASTCSENGTQEAFCPTCQKKIVRSLETTEHQFGEWEIVKQATLEHYGSREKSCTVCGMVYPGMVSPSKEERLALLKDELDRWDMRLSQDRVTDTTFYLSKEQPRNINEGSYIFPYIGQKGNDTWLRLKFNYTGDNWIFYERITVWIDGTSYSFKCYDSNLRRDNGGGDVWETYDISPTSDDINMLKEIAASNQTIVRFEGDTRQYDFKVSYDDKLGISRVVRVYELLQR